MRHWQSIGAAALAFSLAFSGATATAKSTGDTPPEYDVLKQATVVVGLDDRTVTADAVIWHFDKKPALLMSTGKKWTDLQLGDIIAKKDTGILLRSYPGQGFLTEVVKYDGSFAKRASAALQALIEKESKKAPLLNMKITEIKDNALTVQYAFVNQDLAAKTAVLDLSKKGR